MGFPVEPTQGAFFKIKKIIDRNWKLRLVFAKEHREKGIFFEKGFPYRFQIFINDGRARVWRKAGIVFIRKT